MGFNIRNSYITDARDVWHFLYRKNLDVMLSFPGTKVIQPRRPVYQPFSFKTMTVFVYEIITGRAIAL